jgi:guanine deaminase
MTDIHNQLMQEAIALSFESMRSRKGGPYGAIVVKDGKVIGKGMNQVTATHDPTAHAELLAIQAACQTLKSWLLTGCELYTSCEPCPMCMSTIYWAKLDRVYYANSKEDAAQFGFNSLEIYKELALPLAERKLPMIQLLQAEFLPAFQEWSNQADKIGY